MSGDTESVSKGSQGETSGSPRTFAIQFVKKDRKAIPEMDAPIFALVHKTGWVMGFLDVNVHESSNPSTIMISRMSAFLNPTSGRARRRPERIALVKILGYLELLGKEKAPHFRVPKGDVQLLRLTYKEYLTMAGTQPEPNHVIASMIAFVANHERGLLKETECPKK